MWRASTQTAPTAPTVSTVPLNRSPTWCTLAQTIDASCQLKPVSIRTRHIVHIVVVLSDWLFSVDVQVEPPTPIPARRSARNSAGDVADWIEVNWLSWIANGTE